MNEQLWNGIQIQHSRSHPCTEPNVDRILYKSDHTHTQSLGRYWDNHFGTVFGARISGLTNFKFLAYLMFKKKSAQIRLTKYGIFDNKTIFNDIKEYKFKSILLSPHKTYTMKKETNFVLFIKIRKSILSIAGWADTGKEHQKNLILAVFKTIAGHEW